MAENETLILRAALDGESSIYREIEIEASKSLYKLAEAIVAAFGFDFDHAFGFYTGAPFAAKRKLPIYELFADMGEADAGVLSVKRTKVAKAFPAVGHSLTFLFDYGDEWRFRVQLKGTGRKVAKVRYPRVVASRGEASEQYPDPEADDEGSARYGINLATGEKIKIGR
jgi:hypothetical protein